jgi:hypothetical protein
LIGLIIGAKALDKGFVEFEVELPAAFVMLPAVMFPAFVILAPAANIEPMDADDASVTPSAKTIVIVTIYVAFSIQLERTESH